MPWMQEQFDFTKPWPTYDQMMNHGKPQVTNDQIGQIAVDMASPFAKMGGLIGHTVWHGSPHKWMKPSTQHIGKGEGAQAYGYGFYGAENKNIARGYRDRLSNPREVRMLDGEEIPSDHPFNYLHRQVESKGGAENVIKEYTDQFDDHLKFRAEELRHHFDNPRNRDSLGVLIGPENVDQVIERQIEQGLEVTRKNWQGDIDYLESIKGKPITRRRVGDGYLYKIDIPDEQLPQYMDWDAPLSQQPAKVRESLKGLLDVAPTKLANGKYGLTALRVDGSGKNIYGIQGDTVEEAWDGLTGDRIENLLTMQTGSRKDAAKKMHESGILGIRYFDGNSRSKGRGNRNWVVFDPDTVKVERRQRGKK